jgi:SnoaL-like protein
MKRSPEIEKEFRDTIEALERGDIEFIKAATSRNPGVVSIGSDPDEYERGFEKIMGMMGDSTPEGPLGIHVRLSEIRGYEQGDVGWADGTGTFERDGESVEVRFTSVAVREGGRWIGVQNHASIGVPNARVFDEVYRRPRAANRG